MKISAFLFLIIGISVFTVACDSESRQQPVAFESAPVDTMPKKDYLNVVFASKRDTTCHMPLSAGIGDTLHFHGKIYGFCSKECKDAFVEQLKTEKKL